MAEIHYFCTRCGTILVGFTTPPNLCPRCGGVEIEKIGKEGDYNLKEIRKEYNAPFRPDPIYKNESS